MATTCTYPGLNVRRAMMVHRRGVLPSVCNVRAEIDASYPCGGTLAWTYGASTWIFTGCRVQQTYKDHQYERDFVGWNHQILDRRASWPDTRLTVYANVFQGGAVRFQKDAKVILQEAFAAIGELVDLSLMPEGFYPEVYMEDIPATVLIKHVLAQTFTTIVPTLSDGFAVVPLGSGAIPSFDDATHRVEPFCSGVGPSEIRVDMRPTVFQYPVFMEAVVIRPSSDPQGREIVPLRQHASSQWLGLASGYRNLNPFVPWPGTERVPLSSITTEFEASAAGPSYNHAFTMFRLGITHEIPALSPAVIGVLSHNGKGISAPGYDVDIESLSQVTLLENLVDGEKPWLFGRYHGSTQYLGMDSMPAGPADTMLSPFRGTSYRNFQLTPELWSVRTADPIFLPTHRIPIDYSNPDSTAEGTGWATEPILWLYCAYMLRDTDGRPVRKSYSRSIGGAGGTFAYRANMAHVLIYRNNAVTVNNQASLDSSGSDILDAIELAMGSYPHYDITYGGIKPFLPSGKITRTDWQCDAVKPPTSRVLIGVEDDLWD